MDEALWISHTSVADVVEIEYAPALDRYRWRNRVLCQGERGMRREAPMGFWARREVEEEWNYGPIPDNIKPRWMK